MKTHIGQPLTNSTLKATGLHFAQSIVPWKSRYNKSRAIWREKGKLPLKKYNEGSGQNGYLFVWLKWVIKNVPPSLEIKVFIVLWETHYNFPNLKLLSIFFWCFRPLRKKATKIDFSSLTQLSDIRQINTFEHLTAIINQQHLFRKMKRKKCLQWILFIC